MFLYFNIIFTMLILIGCVFNSPSLVLIAITGAIINYHITTKGQ